MSHTDPTPIGVWAGLVALVMDNRTAGVGFLQDAMGMPFSRYRVLRRVESGDWSQRDLAAALHVDAPAASVIVSDLLERGYVERIASPDDGRVKLVRITAAGAALLQRLRQLPDAVPAPVAHLTAAERERLALLIDKMRAEADAAEADA